jgi:hypothetical protein
VKSDVGKVSQEMLFAFGEALSVPHGLRKRLLESYSIARPIELRMRNIPKYAAGWYEPVHYNLRGNRAIVLNSAFIDTTNFYSILYALKHETGHAIDQALALSRMTGRICRVSNKIPILSAISFDMACEKLFRVVDKVYVSKYPDYTNDWKRRLRRSSVRMARAKTIFIKDWGSLTLRTIRAKARIENSFVSAYAASAIVEGFATGWAAYTTFDSPWARKHVRLRSRSFLQRVSPREYRYFQKIHRNNSRIDRTQVVPPRY